ncbi:MAG: TonB-dependent receptor [Hyphomonadaceae bacterium]
MSLRPAFLTIVLGSTALIPAAAHAQLTSVGSSDASLTQEAAVASRSAQKLNVGLAQGGFAALANQPLTFKTYWNYDSLIYIGEVRVFDKDDTSLSNPLKTIRVERDAPTVWTPTGRVGQEYLYVLRVYNRSGMYDETNARVLRISNRVQTEAEAAPSSINIFRQDNTAVRNIPVPTVTRSLAVPVQSTPVVPPRVQVAAPAARAVVPVAPVVPSVPQVKPVVTDPVPVLRTATPIQGASPAFEISIDEADETEHLINAQNVNMSYDGLKAVPLLNAGLDDGSGAVQPGEIVRFNTYWNYNHWIDRAEIRVFDEDDNLIAAPVAAIAVGTDGHAKWTVPVTRTSQTYSYVLRVYNSDGKFDETRRKLMTVTSNSVPETDVPPATAIYGNDNTERRNIEVTGGTVTVSSHHLNADGVRDLRVFGQPVIRDEQGDFAVQQVLPAGAHVIDMSYVNSDNERIDITRSVDIPKNDFFFVGLGDLTVGRQGNGARALVEAGGEDFDQTFVNGRAAFYLKGKVKGKYLITASLDTTEDDISNIFSNLNDRDPESLLRRLDPDRFYPVYGDDSTFSEDAPTQGRFYVRVEKGDDSLVWGNFLTNITSTEFSQIDRGLYGAKLEYNSKATTSRGERRSRVTLFAADPGTVPGRDEFRGTGGSVFFLERQDLTIGSERVRIEVRDEESGLVIETRDLRPFVDYDVDYIQGRIILAEALASTQLATQIVRDGTLSGGDAYLVVRYEFTPGLEDVGGFTTGGRGEAWLGDNVRVGVTGQQEETGDVDQTLLAADIVVRATDSTYFKGEFANTQGQAFGENASLDGGFTFENLESLDTDADANAYRVEGAVGLQDVSDLNGQVSGYYEDIEAGFSGPGRLAQADTERFGAAANLGLSADGRSDIAIKYDSLDIEGGLDETTVSADLRIGVTPKLSVGVGARYNDVEGSAVGRNGDRTDIGAEVEYTVSDSLSGYVFGQGTVSRSGLRQNGERYGAGASVRLNDRVTANGEVSGGSGGLGALGGLTYQRQDGEEYYLNYALDAERTEPGVDGTSSLLNSQNTLTVGGRKRFNSYVSVYGEERASFGDTSGLTNAYGIDFTLGDHWSLGASFEIGDVEDATRIVDREAFTVSGGYTSDKVVAGAAFEWRQDEQNGDVRESWFLRSNASIKLSPDWRALLKFNRAESTSSQGAFFAGEFTEAQVAGAYRPTENDRFNALIRYTYFEDLAPPQQISNSGAFAQPAQRSHIFSLDGEYRLTNWLTLGAKYGLRNGDVSITRLDDDFVDSTAQLGIIRADVHIVKKWDALIEGRILDVSGADDTRSGILAALYRHVGDNARIGIGYNFTDFSSDLTDQSFDDNGVFLNLVAKF